MLQRVALVQPQRQRQRMLAAEAFELFDAVLQDVQRFQPGLQVHAVLLQLDDLVQVGLHVGGQRAVAHVRPRPAAQQQAQRQHQSEEGGDAQPRLGRAGKLPHGVAVGEDDLGEQVAQEEAVLGEHLAAARGAVRGQAEAARDALGRGAVGGAFLQRAGEVEAAEHRLVLEGVLVEQRHQEAAQRRLDRRELQRKAQQPRRQLVLLVQRDLRHADFLQAVAQFIEALVEQRRHIGLGIRLEGQAGAPDAVALLLFAVAEEFREAGDQVGLGEHHVDRGEHFQPLGQLLHALAQILGEVDGELGAVLRQLRHAHRHHDAVDRGLGTVALEQVQEAEPFAAVFLVHRIAAGRVEQDTFGSEEPVAVARAADALDHRAALVGERKLQARVQHRRALAGRRVADHDVPGQFIERRVAGQLPELGALDGLDRLGQAHAQGFDLLALVGGAGLVGRLLQRAFQAGARAARAPALPQCARQP